MIRPLTHDEAREMWHEGFETDTDEFFEAYWTMRSGTEKTRGLFVDGRCVSALHLIPEKVMIRGVPFPAVMVAGVSTRRSERRKGYAALLMRDAEQAMRKEGAVLAVLDPFLEAFYEPFGYCTCTWYKDMVFNAPEAGDRVQRTDDEALLRRIAAARSAERNCLLLRTQEDWAFRLRDLFLENGTIWVDNELKNYALTTRDERAVHVFEHSLSPEDSGAFMNAICAQEGKPVICPMPADPAEEQIRHGAMFLPLDLTALLMRVPHGESEKDLLIRERERVLKLHAENGKTTVTEAEEPAQVTSEDVIRAMLGSISAECAEAELLREYYPEKRTVLWEQY